MNMHHSFAPERALAQHCPELTERGPRSEERAEYLRLWRRDATAFLEADLMPIFMGEKLVVKLGEPEPAKGSEIFAKIGPVAVNCLLRCGAAEQTLLLSADLANAMALTDRSFGGNGTIPSDAPDVLPRSAAILIDRLALVVARAISRATDGVDAAQTGDVVVRSESAIRLKPFEADCDCVMLALNFGPEGSELWSMLIAMPEAEFDGLLPGLNSDAASLAALRGPADPRSKPFAEIPLPLDAILAEFELSLDGLETLSPGDEIPLSVPREIPLQVNDQSFARGTVGTLDEHMAVRVTRLSHERLPS